MLCLNCRECEVINQVDEDDTIYRVVTPSVSKGGKGKDFILLASRRKPCDPRCCKMASHTLHICNFLCFNTFYILFPVYINQNPFCPSKIHYTLYLMYDICLFFHASCNLMLMFNSAAKICSAAVNICQQLKFHMQQE